MQQFLKFFLFIILISNCLTVHANDDSAETERCYCVSLKGQNDGGDHGGKGSATEDYSCNDWIVVSKGSCLDMGGSLVKGQAPKK